MRVSEADVARILLAIATEPNRRSKPVAGDLDGPFDYWFDGGAVSMLSQNIRYLFADGTTALRGISLKHLSVIITFVTQEKVTVIQS